ncbi:type II toxin-antitoxin system VapC family toxin [Rhizobium sp. LjRoot254]|uniref:type II toxin-antitoxin system VapC family toxin n=1 Tax=Rhizobium sp. LjRoot254 TaxID=3342297 RepID=UPI003ED164DD
MRVLLDTHALLWWLADDPGLSAVARQTIAESENTIFVSAASAWEIATKFAKGKLPSAEAIIPNLTQIVAEEGFLHLPITIDHMIRSAFLPGDHRDPFDRILAAQGLIEDLILLSTDEKMHELGVSVSW